jgi:hypothetical protein
MGVRDIVNRIESLFHGSYERITAEDQVLKKLGAQRDMLQQQLDLNARIRALGRERALQAKPEPTAAEKLKDATNAKQIEAEKAFGEMMGNVVAGANLKDKLKELKRELMQEEAKLAANPNVAQERVVAALREKIQLAENELRVNENIVAAQRERLQLLEKQLADLRAQAPDKRAADAAQKAADADAAAAAQAAAGAQQAQQPNFLNDLLNQAQQQLAPDIAQLNKLQEQLDENKKADFGDFFDPKEFHKQLTKAMAVKATKEQQLMEQMVALQEKIAAAVQAAEIQAKLIEIARKMPVIGVLG